MIFNGIKKDYVKVTMELFRPLTPPIEFNTTELIGGGARVRSKRLMDMELPVPITIQSDKSIELLKQELSEWLVHDEPKKLKFHDQDERYYLAYFKSMELNEYDQFAKGVITFYMPKANRFGEDKILNISAGSSSLNVTGELATEWVLTVLFDNTFSSYRFTRSGAKRIYIQIDRNFGPGDTLVINYNNRSATLNGIDISQSIRIIDAEWNLLSAGPASISSTVPAKLSYPEKYY